MAKERSDRQIRILVTDPNFFNISTPRTGDQYSVGTFITIAGYSASNTSAVNLYIDVPELSQPLCYASDNVWSSSPVSITEGTHTIYGSTLIGTTTYEYSVQFSTVAAPKIEFAGAPTVTNSPPPPVEVKRGIVETLTAGNLKDVEHPIHILGNNPTLNDVRVYDMHFVEIPIDASRKEKHPNKFKIKKLAPARYIFVIDTIINNVDYHASKLLDLR